MKNIYTRVAKGNPNLVLIKNARAQNDESIHLKNIHEENKGMEFKSIEEINNWAKENLLIKDVDYSGFDLRVANIINDELARLQKRFPQVMQEVKWLGTLKGKRQDMVNSGDWERLKSQVCSNIDIEHTGRIKKAISRIESYFSDEYGVPAKYLYIEKEFRGIGFNIEYVSNYDILINMLRKAKEEGRMFVKENEEIECMIRHEVGQVMHLYLIENKLDEFVKVKWKEFLKQIEYSKYRYILNDLDLKSPHYIKAQFLLSKYAATSEEDFFAEAFSEYISSPNPREAAACIGKGIEEVF